MFSGIRYGIAMPSNRSVRIASRMVAGKPALRERDGDFVSAQPVLNLGDNELRANNVGDQDAWRGPRIKTVQGTVDAIKMLMTRNKDQPAGADGLPAPVKDNNPPPTAGGDNFPALQMPDGMR